MMMAAFGKAPVSGDAVERVVREDHRRLIRDTNRVFVAVLLLQCVGVIALAMLVTPSTWIGDRPGTHIHVIVSLLLAPALAALPIWLMWTRPSDRVTRVTIAAAQVLFSTLLIHITGGRIESHFHIFGSLAFLSFYRDRLMLVVAAGIVMSDHILRGYFAPESVFGVLSVSNWRWLEHTAWVVFECVFLFASIGRAQKAARERAELVVNLESRRDAAEHLVQQQQQALDAAACVSVLDTDGAIVFANENFRALSGYTSAELEGVSPRTLCATPADESVFESQLEALGAGTITRMDLRQRRKDGREFWVHSTVVPVRDQSGRSERFIRIDLDITNKKAHEEAIRTAQLEAEAASRSKSEFLANMSHEIRTPMAAIVGFTDLISGLGDSDADQSLLVEAIDRIRRNGNHLVSIINDILDVSKIEAGMMTVEPMEVSFVRFVEDVAYLLAPLAQEKGLDFRVEYETSVPGVVLTDPLRLKQIIFNLMSNAIKFTASGRVVLRVGQLVDVRGRRMIRFVCEDTGIGMTAEQMGRMCEAFTQADYSITRKYGGTGLGLRISSAYSEMLGGSLVISSEAGKGASIRALVEAGPCRGVRFITPEEIAREARSAPEGASACGGDIPEDACAGRRVLLVEDGPDNQRLITTILRRAGAEVDVATNGAEALERFEASVTSEHPYNLILLDMQMPVMDGYTTANRIRERGWCVPIVALTAHAMSGDREKCVDAGCDDYATKPLTRGKLVDLVTAWSSAWYTETRAV